MQSNHEKLNAFLNELNNFANPGAKLDAQDIFRRFFGQPENVHVFRIVYIPQTNTLPARVRVYSERFKQVITLSWHDDKFEKCQSAQDRAVIELKERGFNIVSIGSGNACMYVMSDTFKPFKQ